MTNFNFQQAALQTSNIKNSFRIRRPLDTPKHSSTLCQFRYGQYGRLVTHMQTRDRQLYKQFDWNYQWKAQLFVNLQRYRLIVCLILGIIELVVHTDWIQLRRRKPTSAANCVWLGWGTGAWAWAWDFCKHIYLGFFSFSTLSMSFERANHNK